MKIGDVVYYGDVLTEITAIDNDIAACLIIQAPKYASIHKEGDVIDVVSYYLSTTKEITS